MQRRGRLSQCQPKVTRNGAALQFIRDAQRVAKRTHTTRDTRAEDATSCFKLTERSAQRAQAARARLALGTSRQPHANTLLLSCTSLCLLGKAVEMRTKRTASRPWRATGKREGRRTRPRPLAQCVLTGVPVGRALSLCCLVAILLSPRPCSLPLWVWTLQPPTSCASCKRS